MPARSGWDDFAEFLPQDGAPSAPADPWSDFSEYLRPAPRTGPMTVLSIGNGPDPRREVAPDTAVAPAPGPKPGLLSRVSDWWNNLGSEPGLLHSMTADFEALGRATDLEGHYARNNIGRPNPEAAARPAPTTEDVVRGARLLAGAAFPVATGLETAVGGAVGAATGQENPFGRAYEEGAFGNISRATGLDQRIADLGEEHPNLAAGLNIAGTVVSSAGVEGLARAGIRKGVGATRTALQRATNIGEEVAEGFRSLTPEDFAPQPAAGSYLDDAPRMPPASYQTGRRLLPPGSQAPVPEGPIGPAIPMGPPVREPSPLDPFARRPLGLEEVPEIVPGAHFGRGNVRQTLDPYDAAQVAEERSARELEAGRAAQDPAVRRAKQEENLDVRGRLGALGLDYSGGVPAQMLPALAGGAAGGLTGDGAGERARNAAIGAGLGLGAGAAARSVLAKGAAAAPAYASDPDVASILSTISKGERAPKAIRERIRGVGQDLYTRLIDELHPLKQFGRKVGGGEELANEASRAAGWQAAAEERLRTQFKGVLRTSKGNEEGALALTKAERALELAENGFAEKGVDLDVARRTVEKLSQIPEVRSAADALRGYYRQLLDYKLANGVISQESYDAIVKKGEYYIPFVRDMEGAENVATAGGGKNLNRGTGVRKMTDSAVKDLDTVDPYQQAILDTFEAERTVAKQRVTNVVAQIVEDHPDAASDFLVRVHNPDAVKGGRYVQANVNGKQATYKVIDEGLYNAWASFDPQTQTLFSKVLRPFKKMLQVGVTTLPDFAVANAIRDNAMAALQYGGYAKQSAVGAGVGAALGAAGDEEDRMRGAMRGAAFGAGGGPLTANLARTLGAMRNLLKNDELYQEWVREGGAGFGFYARDQKGAAKVLKELQKEGVELGDVLSPKSWWQTFQAINHAVEQAPRLARYKSLREAGSEIPEAIAGSRDISLDFSRIGKDMKGVASANTFYNAQVQGWDKLARMLKDKKTWAAGAAMLTAPSIALWSVNKDNPEYWSRPDWERNLFWLVPKSGEGGGFWRIPKPFELGWVFASIPERLLDYAYRKDPEALKHGFGDMASTYGVSNLLPLTTLATPVIENLANYDTFRNRPIDSAADQRLPEGQRFDETTSTLAVKLGGATGVSPKKIDHLITGWTGSAGQTALDITSSAARKAGLDTRPEPAPGRTPMVGRFSTRPDQTSDAETMLYERFTAGEQAMNGLRELAQGNDPAAIEPYVVKYRDELRDYYALREQARGLEEIRRARRMIREADVPSERKGAALAELSALAAQIAANHQPGDALARRQ